MLPPSSTNLKDLSWLQAYEIFHRLRISPDYLDCARFKDYSMQYDNVILAYDVGINNLLVVPSPNFPEAGKGLISNRKQPITKETGLPYWGEVFAHMKDYCTIDELNLEKSVSDRLVKLPIQPFLHLGLELYILGSLSCAATYSNDAEFNGWGEKPKKKGVIQNNCYLTYAELPNDQTIEGFLNWLKSCPIWIETFETITFGEEFLTEYLKKKK